MYHQTEPSRPRHRRWLITLTVVLVVGMVTTVVVVLLRDNRTAGLPRAADPPGASGSDADPGDTAAHELTEVTQIDTTGYPKEEGMPSGPDELAMEVHGDTGYVATRTTQFVHLTAFNLADGETVWQQDVPMEVPPTGFYLVATNDVLLVRVTYNSSYADTIAAHDLATGEVLWDTSGNLSYVVANRMIMYDSDADVINAYDLATAEQLWGAAADGGRASEYAQETAESRARPRDIGDEHHASFTVAANTDESQYIVQAVMYSGALTVFDLATGQIIAQGNAGEKMMQVVAYEDTVYVYRQTPRELKAYAVTDLSTPKWSVQTPVSADGSTLDICGERLLCLKMVSGSDSPIQAVDTETGETRWETNDYRTSYAPTMVGDRTVVSHQGGTAILDPETGEATATFDSEVYAMPGDGVVVGLDGEELQLSEPDGTTVSLGTAPGTALTAGTCEWTSTLVLCADEDADAYQLWRYRG